MALKSFSTAVVVLLLAVILLAIAGKAAKKMGLFGRQKELVYAFSGVEGQLLYKGSPAAGAVVTRSYAQMDDAEVKESVFADDQGRFTFDSIKVEYKAPILSPLEYLSYQVITVHFNNMETRIWGGGKVSKEEYSEFKGKPRDFTCELTDERRTIDFGVGFIGTNCFWSVE